MAKEFELSEGGANHQKPQDDDHVMTTAQGHPVADDQNWLSAGPRGPQLLEDQIAREDLPLRPRADPRARGPCARLWRARPFRA